MRRERHINRDDLKNPDLLSRAVLIAILFTSLGVVAQSVESSPPSSNPPSDHAQTTAPSVPRTGGPSDHCAILTNSPTPNDVTIKNVSGGLLVKKVAPTYPASAKAAHIEGTVVLCAKISKEGEVQIVRVLFGPQELIPAAVEAVKQWRYEPYRVNGEPVELDSEIRMDFTLHRQ